MQRRTTTVRRTASLLTALMVLAGAGCTDQEQRARAAPSSPSSTGSSSLGLDTDNQTVTVTEPAFSVESSVQDQSACYEEASSDVGSIDYTWKATTDVTVTDVELVDAQGVRLVGAETVPPVNRGGTIPVGGEFGWGAAGPRVGTRFVVWDEREPVDQHSFSAGETGLFVLHLRYAPGRGSSAGLRVGYTVDGEDAAGPFTAEAANQLRWDVVGTKKKCRP